MRGGGRSAPAPHAERGGRGGAGTRGPRPGARPSPARSAPAPPGQAAASARRALRPQRPPGRSRDRRGRRPGRGRGQRGGAPGGPRGCGVPPVLRPLSAASRTSLALRAVLYPLSAHGLPIAAWGNPKRGRPLKAGSGGGLWASQDPSRKKQFIPPVFASSGLPDPFGLLGPSSKAQELPHCMQTSSGQTWVQIPAPMPWGSPKALRALHL